MKDRLALVVGAVAFSALGWAFWHFLGNDALNAMLILALVGVVADNVRLRRRLSAHE